MKARLLPSRASCATQLRRLAFLTAAMFVMAGAATANAQSSTEVIRGKVVGPDSTPLAGVEVLVTGLATRISQRTRTDDRGAFTVLFTNPEADYILAVRKIGFASTSLRLSRTGITNILYTDVQLHPNPKMLDTVTISSADEPADRRAVGEMGSSDLAEQLFLADPSNLMALLLSIPGGGMLGDSSSVIALSTTTLDGANFKGRELPPDALASARGITATADPAKGGFGGGTVSTTMKGGTDIFAATVRGNYTDPSSMAWNDPAWTRALQKSTDASGTANGPIVKGKLRYNVSWRAVQRESPWFNLYAPRTEVLSQQGIVIDTVRAATSALNGLGVPLTAAGIPTHGGNSSASATSVLDWTANATSSMRLTYGGNWGESIGDGGASAFPTRGSHETYSSAFGSLKGSTMAFGLLDELTVSYNSYDDVTRPYLSIPTASVRIGTDFGDGRTGFSTLGFGGAPGLDTEHSHYGELINEVSWLPKNGSHKLKVGGRVSFDESRFFQGGDAPLAGRYTYLSVADLVANKPASYDRTLNAVERHATMTNNSVWVGEEWLASRSWQFQGGLRFDFFHPDAQPAYNHAVDSLFGLRTDHIPTDFGMSPRIGFSWSSKARLGRNTAGGASSLGGMSAAQVQSLPFELVQSLLAMERDGTSTLPGIGVNGTIGAFRGTLGTQTVADYIGSSGVGTRVILSCVGDDIPVPDWRTMTQGPSQCANGPAATNYSIESPIVRAFAPDYHQQTSWRANVSVDGIRVPGQWIVKFSGSAAFNQNLQSNIDLNLNPVPKFHLASEANRPVYVDAAAIIPYTGTNSQAASRITQSFTSVTKTISDLHGYSAQFSASIVPPRPLLNEHLNLSLNYSLSRSASEARGNSRVGIEGDPFEKSWVRSNQPLHSFRLSANGRYGWLNGGITASLYSGVPFTPKVAGDINGDGDAGNDRAFIPNPASLPDTSLARQLNDLIAHAPAAARDCLTSQLGQMAAASHCSTPWQFRLDISASVTPPSSWGYNDRLRLIMTTQNASGGLVRLFGLQNTPLGQTTLSTTPINTLFYVTGFDPSTQRYKYTVNQLFGQPTNYGSLRQRFAPMQMQIGLEYKFGGPVLNPVSRAMGFREQVGKDPLSESDRRAAVAKLKKDPVAPILKVKDSLGLSADQASRLAALSASYGARSDTALGELTIWVVRKGTRVYDQDLSPKLAEARAALAKISADLDKRAKAVLTPDQVARFTALSRQDAGRVVAAPEKEKP